MRKLLDNIADGFIEMDNTLKKMNASMENNLTQENVKQLLSEAIPVLCAQLKEIKLNMAAFDLAVNAKRIGEFEEPERQSIIKSRASYIETADGLQRNKSQLETAINHPSVLTSSFQDLVGVIDEWEFMLLKHIETVDKLI